MPKFEVEFYQNSKGKEPVQEFLLSLDSKMRAKMLGMISLLQEYGNDLREPYSKYLSDGIFELRAKQGSDISRVLYFFCIGQTIILTNGFIKKTQKTPQAEIDRAKRYRAEYLRREKKG